MTKASHNIMMKCVLAAAGLTLILGCADERGFRARRFPQPVTSNQGSGTGGPTQGQGGQTPPPTPPPSKPTQQGQQAPPASGQSSTGADKTNTTAKDQLIDQTASLITEITNPGADQKQKDEVKNSAKSTYLTVDKAANTDKLIKGISVRRLGSIDATGQQSVEIKALLSIDGKDEILTAQDHIQWGVDPNFADPSKIKLNTLPLADINDKAIPGAANLDIYAYFCNDQSCKMDQVLRILLQIPQSDSAEPTYALVYEVKGKGADEDPYLRTLSTSRLTSFDAALSAAQKAAAPAPAPETQPAAPTTTPATNAPKPKAATPSEQNGQTQQPNKPQGSGQQTGPDKSTAAGVTTSPAAAAPTSVTLKPIALSDVKAAVAGSDTTTAAAPAPAANSSAAPAATPTPPKAIALSDAEIAAISGDGTNTAATPAAMPAPPKAIALSDVKTAVNGTDPKPAAPATTAQPSSLADDIDWYAGLAVAPPDASATTVPSTAAVKAPNAGEGEDWTALP